MVTFPIKFDAKLNDTIKINIHGVMFFNELFEMTHMLISHVLDTEIINYQWKNN